MRYVLLVQYDGTHFSGYQRQKKGERTVQGELERAASCVFGAETRITASGRTDAGVHARGQVCHLDAETSIPADRIAVCMNAHLPPDVCVIRSAAAPSGFDCSAGKRKTYCYRAYTAKTSLPLLARYAVRLEKEPSLDRMKEAARRLTGEHDFRAFSSVGSSAKTSIRTIYAIDIVKREQTLCNEFEVSVTGNGFLYNMVRILAGEIFAVGCGKDPAAIGRAFETGERSLIAKTMPPQGLTLESVDYGFPVFGSREEE